ncbi:hypothetical protein [Caballeronia sp. GACF4]|uniref:hypothetical protein n=1 Tax=Caballeronia sp. GACF4 TaxID=2921763 RepID=UPI002027A3A7|nr:hypothetical protein [Caballeronia sp. GACF4]
MLPPLTDADIERVDRRGAAKLLGKSVSVIEWLEKHDPDFPATFSLGRSLYFLTADLRTYVIRKAAQATAEKQQRMQAITK